MNNQFESYVKSSSFNLSLSERQIIALIALYRKDEDAALHRLNMGVLQALDRRGLCEWHRKSNGEFGGFFITDAGELVAKMLILAGYESLLNNFKKDAA